MNGAALFAISFGGAAFGSAIGQWIVFRVIARRLAKVSIAPE